MKKHLSHIAAALATTMLLSIAVSPLSAAAAAPDTYIAPSSAVVSSEENSTTQQSRLNTTSLRLTIEYNTPNPVSQLYLSSVAPYDSVYQWYSTNPSVATVNSNGLVTALKTGSTTIVANTYTTTLRCTVTVTSNVGKVSMNYSKMSLEGIGGSGKLTATVQSANGSSIPITWTSSNPAAAVVDANGVVTAVGNGESTITATASTGRSASCTVYTGTRVAEIRAAEAQAEKEAGELVWLVVGGLGVLATILVIAASSD